MKTQEEITQKAISISNEIIKRESIENPTDEERICIELLKASYKALAFVLEMPERATAILCR